METPEFTSEWFGGELFTAEWFPYYFERFEGSDTVAVMKLSEEGAYHRAIRLAWKYQTLPADAKMFAAKIQKGCTIKIAETLLKTFLPVPENPARVYHPVVETVRFEQLQKRLNRVKGGKASRNGLKITDANKDTSSITEQCSSNTPTDLDLDLNSDKDLKRLINACVRANEGKDERLVEVAVIHTIFNRSGTGSTDKVRSATYFQPEIDRTIVEYGQLKSETIDVMLENRRSKLPKILSGETRKGALIDSG